MAEINKFLLSHDMKVILVVFDRKAFELSGKLVGDIEEYIDEHSADEIRDAEYGGRYGNVRRERLKDWSPCIRQSCRILMMRTSLKRMSQRVRSFMPKRLHPHSRMYPV